MLDDFESMVRACIRELFRHRQPIPLYELHARWKFSPFSLATFVAEFQAQGFVFVQGETIQLSNKGRQWALQNRKKLFFASKTRPWAQSEAASSSAKQVNAAEYLPRRDPRFSKFFEDLAERDVASDL